MVDDATPVAQQLRRYQNASAVTPFEPADASEDAEHGEIAIGIARIVPLAVRLGLKLVDAVFGMGENCQGNRPALSAQSFDTACGRGAGRLKIVFTQDP